MSAFEPFVQNLKLSLIWQDLIGSRAKSDERRATPFTRSSLFALRSTFVATSFCFTLTITPALAQLSPDASHEPEIKKIILQPQAAALSEQEVITSALENSRKLQFLGTNVEIANYRLRSAGWLRNPELRISDVSTHYYTEERNELEVGLRLRFPKLGELSEEKQDARVELWDRRVNESRYRDELIARVRRSYASVLMYDQLTEIAQERVALEDKRIRIIEKMVDFGQRSIVFFTKAKMWHAESKNDYTRAVQRQGHARRTLSSRAGIAEDTQLIMADLPEVTLELDRLLEIAYENRPEIELVEERIELAQRQSRYEFYKVFPWPSFLEVSYHYEEADRQDWAELRMGIDLPLFDWNIGNIKATNLAVKKKEDESDVIRESIAEEVRVAYEIYKDSLLDWKNFSANAGNLIADAQKVIDEAKQHQTLLLDEVVEMELTILDTRELLTEKRRDLVHAVIELLYFIGIEDQSMLTE